MGLLNRNSLIPPGLDLPPAPLFEGAVTPASAEQLRQQTMQATEQLWAQARIAQPIFSDDAAARMREHLRVQRGGVLEWCNCVPARHDAFGLGLSNSNSA